MKAREIVTSAQILRIEDDGISRATAFPVHMRLAFAQEVVRATIELADGTPRPVLVDTRTQKAVDQVAREYFAGAEAAKGRCARSRSARRSSCCRS
ncbi:DUF7793 family protein [Sorangium sp. So ce388]|uniref:DUF7793 family protein n=1 Tax=Sorangium sp. So ce388 TaxID=3133309 RepID=UPI003F5B2D69